MANTMYDMLTNLTESTIASDCNWPPDEMYNITKENTPTLYFEIIIYPILLFLCTVGNILTIVVLGSEAVISTANVYLIATAFSDLFIVWLELPLYILDVNPAALGEATFFRNTLKFRGVQEWLQNTCILFSDTTLLVLSFERLFVIFNPVKFRNVITLKKAVVIEIIVFLFSSLCMLEHVVLWYYVDLMRNHADPLDEMLTYPQLIKWEETQNHAEVLITIAKWILVILVNVIIIILLARYKKIRATLVKKQEEPDVRDKKTAPKRHVTWVLLWCVGLYSVTQLPNVVYKILQISSRPPHCSYHLTFAHKNAARPIINMFLLSCYSVNFVLYCSTCRKFQFQLGYLSYKFVRRLTTGSLHLTKTIQLNSAAMEMDEIGKEL